MTANEFAAKLWKSAPTVKALNRVGLSHSFTAKFRESFRCRPKEVNTPPFKRSPLRDLLANFDLSHVEVGAVTFTATKRVGDKTMFATMDRDPLYIQGRGVLLGRRKDPGAVIWPCAKSQARFLDALTMHCLTTRMPTVSERQNAAYWQVVQSTGGSGLMRLAANSR